MIVQVGDHPTFQRDGFDVHVYVPIPLTTACLGGEVVVPTLTGSADMKIPAGTRAGDRLIMRGKGISKGSNGNTGNEYVHLDVEIPKNLTDKQKELLKEFAALETAKTSGDEAAGKKNDADNKQVHVGIFW